MKITAAAIQIDAKPGAVSANVERADAMLKSAHQAGASIAVLPEMFNTGYALIPDYAQLAEPLDGPTVHHLLDRSKQWGMMIAAGMIERDGHHLYDSLVLVLPDGTVKSYRKRNLVFWEPFRFDRGREPVIVKTPWGRVGLAICADMIHCKVWDDYRGKIDIALVGAAWPNFACRNSGRKNWLFGHVGPLAGSIPALAANDLGIPVIFANQCGLTQTVIPYLGTKITAKIADKFAGFSAVCDGRHSSAQLAGLHEEIVIGEVTIHPPGGPRSWHTTFPSASEASSSTWATAGSFSRENGSTEGPGEDG